MSLLQATLLFILALSSVNAVQAIGTDDANTKFKDALENLIGDCNKNSDGEVFHVNPYKKQKQPTNDIELQESSCHTKWLTQSEYAISQCDFNGDGKVTIKKTWKADGVSKAIAKKENSCRIALENKLLEQDIAQADARIAQGRAEVVQLKKTYSELLTDLSKDDLLKLIKDDELKIKNETNPRKIKSMKESLDILKEEYAKRIN